MSFTQGIVRIGFLMALFMLPTNAQAGIMELSGNFSYSQSNFGNGGFSWSRRYGASIGYYFLALSEIEFSVQDIVYKTGFNDSEFTNFHDQIYSVDWVQSLSPKSSGFQPYFKLGIGQLNRESSSSGSTSSVIYDSLTGVAGAGLRIFILNFLSIKGECTSYLVGGAISTAKDNLAFNAGISFYF